jgi:hypothetical protein
MLFGDGAVFLVGVIQEEERLLVAHYRYLEFIGIIGNLAGDARLPKSGDYELGEFILGFVGNVHLDSSMAGAVRS